MTAVPGEPDIEYIPLCDTCSCACNIYDDSTHKPCYYVHIHNFSV